MWVVNKKEAIDLSKPRLIYPLLDGFLLGDAVSEHDGVRCFPAIRQKTGEKYIVKVISVPSSRVQLDALLLTGAFSGKDGASLSGSIEPAERSCLFPGSPLLEHPQCYNGLLSVGAVSRYPDLPRD